MDTLSSKTIIIILILISFGFGYFIGSDIATDKTWQKAKERLDEYITWPEEMEITSISGEVQQIQGNKISLKISPLEPLADPSLDYRVVEVDEDTEFYRLLEKNEEQYQKEIEEFDQRTEGEMIGPEGEVTEAAEIAPPDSYTQEEISLADIEVGQRINVRTEENIKEVKQFKAVSVTVQVVLTEPIEESVIPAEETTEE